MYLAPDQVFTNFNYDVDGDGQAETIQQSPGQARRTFDRQVLEQTGLKNFSIMAGPATEAALRDGKPVPYTIIPLDENGQPNYDFSNPNMMDILAGKPVTYDYGKAIDSTIALVQERETLTPQLEAIQQERRMPGPFNQERADRQQAIEDRLKEIEEALSDD